MSTDETTNLTATQNNTGLHAPAQHEHGFRWQVNSFLRET